MNTLALQVQQNLARDCRAAIKMRLRMRLSAQDDTVPRAQRAGAEIERAHLGQADKASSDPRLYT